LLARLATGGAVEREIIRKFFGAINSTSVSFPFFRSMYCAASKTICVEGIALFAAGQKGITPGKDYHATVINCPART
jgi:hypothetical protein